MFQRWEQASPPISYHFSTFSVFRPCHTATPQSGTTVMGRDGGLRREEGWSNNGPSSQMMLDHYFCFRSKSERYSCPGHSLKNRQITILEHQLLDGTTGATGAASGAGKGAGQAPSSAHLVTVAKLGDGYQARWGAVLTTRGRCPLPGHQGLTHTTGWPCCLRTQADPTAWRRFWGRLAPNM